MTTTAIDAVIGDGVVEGLECTEGGSGNLARDLIHHPAKLLIWVGLFIFTIIPFDFVNRLAVILGSSVQKDIFH